MVDYNKVQKLAYRYFKKLIDSLPEEGMQIDSLILTMLDQHGTGETFVTKNLQRLENTGFVKIKKGMVYPVKQ